MQKKILIIDDDLDMLEMLKIVFSGSEFETVLSEKGMTAAEIFFIHPDLILLDVNIKGYIHTGDEICQQIKSSPDLASVPVFLVSSEYRLDILAVKCKADGFLSKPFDILKLKSLIREYIR